MINKPFFYVLLFSIFWAFNILASRYVLQQGIHPLILVTQSLFLTTLMFSAYVLFFHREKFFAISNQSRFGAIISGVIGGGLAGLFSSYGLKFSTSINFGFLIKTATAFTVIFAYLFLKEPLTKTKLFFVTVILTGSYLLSTSGQLIIPHLGDILILLAAAGYGIAAVINRRIIKKDIHADIVSFYRALIGFVVVLPVTLLAKNSVFDTTFLVPVFVVSLFQFLLYLYLNKTLSAASASYMTMMSSMTPVIVALFAIPLFGERLNITQVIGAFLIISGGIATQKTKVAYHT